MNIFSILILTGSFFVCEIAANCDPGYTLAGTFCYKFDASRKGDFDTQKRRCEEDGSHLIEYPNYQSFEDLSAYVKRLYGKALPAFWIGLKGTGGSNLKNGNNFHWLSDLFGPNTKVEPSLLTWWRNYPYNRQAWLCVFTKRGVLVNCPCTGPRYADPILACQYDPLIGRNNVQRQNSRASDDRYYQAAPLPSSYASKMRNSNLASDRRARLNAMRDQRNSGQMVGYGNGGYGSTANSNNGNGYGVDSNDRFGSSQNQNSGNQYGNGGYGQSRNEGNGQYGSGGNGQYGTGSNGQFGNGGNGQSGNGGNGQSGDGGNGQSANGGNGSDGSGTSTNNEISKSDGNGKSECS